MPAMRIARRFFAALFGLWFTVLTVEPARVYSCPMHDGVAARSAHSGHAGHHTGGSSGHDHGAPQSGHACTCLGACASAAAPSAPATPTFAVVVVRVSDSGLREITRAVVSVAFATPFANGPPTV